MNIKAITFDFWGTLFRDVNGELRHQVRVEALRKETGASEQDANQILRDTMRYFLQHHLETQYTLNPHDAVRMICDQLGVSLAADRAAALAYCFGSAVLKHPPAPVENALNAVREAAARVPLAVISDTGFSPGKYLRVLLEWEGFAPFFQTLTFSDETGVAKPQLPMFENTAEQLGVAPNELLHIGDLEPTDIVGVHQVNGKGGLFTAINARYVEGTRADFIFPDWSSFIALLPELTPSRES